MPNPENVKDTKFKPGQSGNPKGMKPGTKHYKTLIKEMLETLADTESLGIEDKKNLGQMAKLLGAKLTKKHLMIFRQFEKASSGDTQAFNALVDREEGRPAQFTQTSDGAQTYEDFLDSLSGKENKNE